MMNIKIAVLDALIDNIESIVQIKESLQYFKFTLSDGELQKLLLELIDKELIFIFYSENTTDEIWYSITEKGKSYWNNFVSRQ